MSKPSTIGGINRLPEPQKREIYTRVIPPELFDKYNINPFLFDIQGHDLLKIVAPAGSTSTEISLFHRHGFPDPVLYGHITDTINGQLHILLYVLNDPESERFDVDRLPDGTPTKFGAEHRNLEAELAAMRSGLTPGQIRRGPRLLSAAMITFEEFVTSLDHDLYFAEPLYYHNAVIFERNGFSYQQGRRRMERIQQGFGPGGDLLPLLDSSTPFRQLGAEQSVRLRSWAIHDGILGEPFTHVTMFKRIGKHAGISTCDCAW
jgi:hypothetical protein